MTYQDFKNKYNGQWVDYDKYYGAQCWDLGQYYFTECLGLPSSVLSGCGMVSNMLYQPKRAELDKYFDEVSVYEMYPGDVCIWDYGNGVGHIAIFDNWDGNTNWFFSQNYPINSPCHLEPINAPGLHAFRRKGTTPQPIQSEYINIPPSIEARNIYNVNTKKQFATIKPKKFGGLTYKILSYQEGKTYAEIETHDYGKVLVKITDMTPITNTPQYSHGNY